MMEFFRLIALNFVVTIKDLIEFCRVIFRYYGNPSFRKVDLALLCRYLFNNPFRISKRFLKKSGAEDVYAYGETPLTSLEEIAGVCSIEKTDHVFELGCGRGRSCFWLNAFKGCKVVGVELIPEFVEIANRVKKKYEIKDVSFRQEDMLQTDLSSATVVYLYGTCYDDDFILALIEKLKKLPAGTRIVTVSYPLEDFSPGTFTLKRCFPVSFNWGIGDVYLQVIPFPKNNTIFELRDNALKAQ